MPRSLLTSLAAFCVALAWSGSWITGKLALATAPPLEISAARFIIAAIVLAAITLATRANLDRGSPCLVVVAGVVENCAYNAFVFVGALRDPAPAVGLIIPTSQRAITVIA